MQKITIPIKSTNVCRNAIKEYMGEEASNNAQVHLDRNICAGGDEGKFKDWLNFSLTRLIFKL